MNVDSSLTPTVLTLALASCDHTDVTVPDQDHPARRILEDLFEEHFCHAPDALKRRFYAHVTPAVAGDALLHLARVRFDRTGFALDQEGVWAICAPILNAGEVVDWGAFDIDRPGLRGIFGTSDAFAVGFEEAHLASLHHPDRRLLVFHDVWSWLKAECSGLLPIDWSDAALHFARGGYELVFTEEREGREIAAQLKQALRPPRMFLRSPMDGAP